MRRPLMLALLMLGSSCYLSHQERRDAATVDGGETDAPAPVLDTGSADSDPLRGCPAEVAHIEVGPEPECESLVIETPPDAVCEPLSSVAVRLTRLGSARWSVLVRSRDPSSTELCYGVLDEVCERCGERACVSGGDLTRHGIGGDLPARRSEVLLVVSNRGGDAWVRVCAPPI